MKKILIALLLTVLSMSCSSKKNNSSIKVNDVDCKKLDVATFSAIQSKIEDCNLTNIPSVLEKLPESFLSNQVFMYRSASLQEASWQKPRVILFNDDASFILTFNSDSSTFETVTFDTKADRFLFREISFAEGRVNFGETNPQKCLDCHQVGKKNEDAVDPRPIWEPYPVWPGAYGAQQSNIFNDNRIYENDTGTSFGEQIQSDAEAEYDQFLTFISNFQNHDRYKYLVIRPPNQYRQANGHIVLPRIELFTDLIMNLNLERQARILTSYNSFKNKRESFIRQALCEQSVMPDSIGTYYMPLFIDEKDHRETFFTDLITSHREPGINPITGAVARSMSPSDFSIAFKDREIFWKSLAQYESKSLDDYSTDKWCKPVR